VVAQNIELTPHEVELIHALVKDGVYADAGEAIHDGLRRIERERHQHTTRLGALRAEVQKGFDDIDQGRYTDLAGAEELGAHLDKLSAEAGRRVAERRASR